MDMKSKVPWSNESTLLYEDIYEEGVFYEMPNNGWNERDFREWREFQDSNYYDGTPPPDFVTRVTPCADCGKGNVEVPGASCPACIEKE